MDGSRTAGDSVYACTYQNQSEKQDRKAWRVLVSSLQERETKGGDGARLRPRQHASLDLRVFVTGEPVGVFSNQTTHFVLDTASSQREVVGMVGSKGYSTYWSIICSQWSHKDALTI